MDTTGNNIQMQPKQACPSCGHCPACGRGGYGVYPTYPLYPTYPGYPYYQRQTPWWEEPYTITWSGTSTQTGG